MNGEYFGRGGEKHYDDYIDFINYVFGFNGDQKDFLKILPKLYKPEYEPVKNSYIALDEGKIKAAVGAFDHDIEVCGTRLRCRGIGNVAVHPRSRSKGYMKKLMDMSVDDMVRDGIDLSILGGRRQRYNYFSYEPTGRCYEFSINSDNMRHVFGADRSDRYALDIRELRRGDAALAGIGELHSKQMFNPCRPADRLFDILCSWGSTPYVIGKNGAFAGYLVYKSESISEIMLHDSEDFLPALVTFFDKLGLSKLNVRLPEFAADYISQLYLLCERYSTAPVMSFSVLSFERVAGAFMKLKAEYESLPDGELRLFVRGRAGDEGLRIAVRGGVPSVEKCDEGYELELSHIEAINMLFSSFCPGREKLPFFARIWLPLPIWLYYTDEV